MVSIALALMSRKAAAEVEYAALTWFDHLVLATVYTTRSWQRSDM